MFEKHNEPLAPISVFLKRLGRNIIFGWILVAVALGIGMLGYHIFANLSWVDAFVNAAMILSGMGPINPLLSDAAKIFAGFYALFSGLVFIMVMGIVFSPIVHRWLHKFHSACHY
ncbi:MAG TPA: hypothetical protein VN698_16705 [Bacteroidia bacterium]|nr:hypothetical protein [Bacteroidia bacterium]